MSDGPTFKKNFPATQGAPLREFNVGPAETITSSFGPPPSAQVPKDVEQRYTQAREERAASMNKIGSENKTRIEILANIGRLTKDVMIGGTTFTLRTLKAKETREAALASYSISKTELDLSFNARQQQIARSIVKIDGHDFGLTIGSDDFDKKLEFIEELEENVVNKLFNEFMSLKKEAEDKYGISTVAEAKEVGEDLKKS
jgi:hypothetical protein